MTQETWSAQRRAIVRDGLGVALATGVYGVSFGAVSVAAGLSVWQTCALSLLMFTGASQFAFVGVAAAGGGPLAAIVTAWLLGLRNAIYGLRLTTLLGYRGWQRFAVAHLVIDESTAMSITRDSRDAARTGLLSAGLGVFAFWNLATLIGALAGATLADPRALGLDAAVGAAFLALLWPRLGERLHRRTAMLGALVALVALPFAPPGMPVLIAGGVCLLGGIALPSLSAPDDQGEVIP